MTQFKSPFIQEAHDRGFIFQTTDLESLDDQMSRGSETGYLGFDATADSLHVGSLMQIMLLHLMQKHGHKPIVLMGGGTTLIGDPSGKDESLQMITEDTIRANIDGISKPFKTALKFGDAPSDAIIVNNYDWLKGLNYIEFLRDYGPHFSVNRMLSFDSVKLRLEREQNLSFLEFNYMIIQAYDFLELNRRYGCTLQMGGGDQWGNIINGVELTRRVEQKHVIGLTTPLITTADGGKMGKTAQGAVWLNSDRLSPYDYWQFWRNTDDRDVGKFLRLFTTLPLPEIEQLEKLSGSEINLAKKTLADEATAFLHGEDAVIEARKTAEKVFEAHSHNLAQTDLPTVTVSAKDLGGNGLQIIELMTRLNLTQSKGEARRLIKGGGARINDKLIEDELSTLTSEAFAEDNLVKISAGKKKHGVVKLEE